MKNKKSAYLYLLITFFAWGSLYVVSKFVLGKVPVFTVLFLRYFIAVIVLLIVNRKSNSNKIEHKDLKYVLLVGFVGYFISVGAQLLGIKLSNASTASLVNSMNPIAIMFFAAIVLKEKFTLKKFVCVIMAVTGGCIILGNVKGGQTLGILFSVISVLLWSFVSVTVRRITQKYDALTVTTYSMVIAAMCTLPAAVCEELVTTNVHFDFAAVIALLYMGIVCTALAYVLWNKSLSILEAGMCSMFYPVQPFVSALLGMIFLSEKITINFVIGAIFIIVGVLFSLSKNN